MLDRKEMARQHLGRLEGFVDRLQLILSAELGDELIKLLPELIHAGACRFEVYNTACEWFYSTKVQPDHSGLYIYLKIHHEIVHASVNFAGLMQQYGDPALARQVVQDIISRKINWSDLSGVLNAGITPADLFAVRRYSITWDMRPNVELCAFYQALKGPAGVNEAWVLLPDMPSSSQIPSQDKLNPVAAHLRRMDFAQIVIDELVEMLFKDTATLESLDKVVALAAIHEKGCGQSHENMLQSQFPLILELHFASKDALVRSTNMEWLAQNGLGEALRRSSQALDTQLIRELARGRIATVYQFLLRFRTSKRDGGDQLDHRAAAEARVIVQGLLMSAFETATREREYGIAAALAQITPEIEEDDRRQALELAMIHNRRIALEWAHFLA
ncbi:hypothetical protein FJZ23_01825 [Candidatus Parcubacteria bacterium]|nr:hypothetical protein [Candidatus Parcubacteria bacterium]